MLFFLITCASFIFFYKSLPLKPLPQWACEMRLLSLWFWKDVSFLHISKLIKTSLSANFLKIPLKMSMKKKALSSKVENVEATGEICVLDLPDLILDSILERLPPDGLCKMASVCTAMRDRCTCDRLWERHMKRKWDRVIGPAAFTEWQLHIVSRKDSGFLERSQRRGLMRSLSRLWPLSLIVPNFENTGLRKSSLPVHSVMSCYLALETGKFWFPAQVYNRENGHVGFMLSCYDAELCYDSCTNTFQARYPPHGRRAVAVENGVTWDRLRAPPNDTTPHDLHISECLNELRPGDHIEIQWRRNKEFPYGWWYGVVGHLESCDGSDNYCRCHESDMVVLEFNQYTRGSRWRRTSVHRKDHHEEGNEADGFYGGIRKLHSNDEISMWRQLWPAEVLE
ncbi:F-box protein At2g26850 [Actinidia eriantha]|uniref:F-box protein At2g26850 n=1 Tax=Actinidia eriantha TaxID=165200 RepID=UPI0025827351|nr:F-box protein At2g26850 [Actinidia eriantha]